MYGNTDFRESVHCSNASSQYNASYQKYQSAVTDIPLCSTVDYCHAAAFRLKLPSCDSSDEQNEYLAFVIPRRNLEKKPIPSKPMQCKLSPEEKCDTGETQYVPKYSPRCRWNTEYRSTIDDCARKRMTVQPKRSRSPICIQKSYHDDTSPQPSAHTYSSRSSAKQFVETGYFPTQRQARTANLCHNNKLQTCEQKRICKDVIRNDEPLPQKTTIPKSILYKDNCYEQNITPQSNYTSSKRPLNKCIPMDDDSKNGGTLQRSTRRPMPRCQFQTCR